MSSRLGPEDTVWSPKADGNYSEWLVQFDNQIKIFCNKANSFENGVSVFPNNAAKGLFNILVSQSSVNNLARALTHGKLGEYLSGKRAFIAFFTVALVFCIICCILTLSLTTCFRGKFRKFCGACTDRPRNPPHMVKARKKLCFEVPLVSGLIGMFALSIVCFIHASSLSYGAKSLGCDFWMAMKGHYFGAANIQAPPNVALDWKGSQVQYEAMSHLKQMVNPKPIDRNEKCQLCQRIEEKFSGKGGLVEVLSESRDRVMHASKLGALLAFSFSEAFNGIFIPGYNNGFLFPDVEFISTNDDLRKRHISPITANLVVSLLLSFAKNLNETTAEAIKLIRADLDRFLGRDSIMLQASYETADTSVTSLGDVDFVMARSIVLWEKRVQPYLHSLLTAAVVITCLLGVGAFCFSFGGSFFFWQLMGRAKKESFLSTKFTSCMGTTFIILLLFSGFSFLMSSILFFVASSGKDACQFTDNIIYDEGRWSVFADALLKETISEHTNIPTVLDTCVKETGDGDVAAALGIKILLDKLAQSVATTKVDLHAIVEKKLDMDFKRLKTHSLADMVKMLVSNIIVDRVKVRLPRIYGSDDKIRTVAAPNGLDWISYEPNSPPVTFLRLLSLDFVKELSIFKDLDQLAYVRDLQSDGLFLIARGSQEAFDWIDSLIKTANDSQIKGICSYHLQHHQLCAEEPNIYMLGKGLIMTSDTEDTYRVTNPWVDANFLSLMKRISASIEKEQRLNTVHAFAQLIYYLSVHNMAASRLLHTFTNKDSSQNIMPPQELHELFKEDFEKFQIENAKSGWVLSTLPLDHFMVSKNLLGDIIVCVDPKNETKQITPKSEDEWASCTFADAISAWKLYNEKVAETIIAGFETASHELLHFINDVTIGSFEALLEKAEDDLEDFNGQFVGTSIRQGVVAGVCGVIMPSITALGLTAIFLWIFSGVGAWVIWKIYHYSHNLQVCGECDLIDEPLYRYSKEKNQN